jgi:hypothetical protein
VSSLKSCKLPFFSELSEGELAEVVSCVHERAFRRGEVVLLEGEAPQLEHDWLSCF